MTDSKYESLLDENTNLKRALTSTKHVLERTLNDYETLKQIHEDFKNQYDKLKRDHDDLSHRNLALIHEKKDIELQFDNTIRNFKMAIEQKQKELEEVQAKVIPSLDHDMLRIKVINEIEGPHRQALEQKQHEADMLQGQVYKLKRQVELISSRAENLRFEAEKDVRDLKERHKLEVNDFMQEIMMLQERIEDNRDKEIIRNLRRELDEIKYRYDETENEMEDLRREKERLREEKNDILIKLNKQIDIEKSDKRNYKAENDRLLIKVRQLENSFSNLDNKSGDYQAELERLQRDNERLYQENENKQKQINGLNNQIRDLEDAQITVQTKLQEQISQSQLQSHEKQISEKNRIVALQREVESYQKTIVDLENKYRNTNFQTTKDLEITKQEVSRIQDQHFSTQRQLEAKEAEVNKLKKDIENLHDEMYYAQRKTKELLLTKDGASPASNLGAGRTGAGAGGRDSELLREALQREEKLKAKVVHLKAKLRAANKKIMELLPYKVLGQKDTNIGVTRDVRVGYASGSPRGLLDNLKSKYGIADAYSGVEVAAPVIGGSDVKYVSAKYGFGLGRTGEQNYRHDVENIRNKYGFERRSLREEERDDEILHTEIERTADEALRVKDDKLPIEWKL